VDFKFLCFYDCCNALVHVCNRRTTHDDDEIPVAKWSMGATSSGGFCSFLSCRLGHGPRGGRRLWFVESAGSIRPWSRVYNREVHATPGCVYLVRSSTARCRRLTSRFRRRAIFAAITRAGAVTATATPVGGEGTSCVEVGL